MKALVFDIYKGTTNDGPGMRDTVFLKGCPLRCLWCHNPEGIPFENRVWYERNVCIGCGECLKACENGALSFTPDGIYLDYSKCKSCMKCADACPTGALSPIAEAYTVEALAQEVLKDREYFFSSGGGVTVSGGEAMWQKDFVCSFFEIMKKNHIHTALDTTGFCKWEDLEAVIQYTDIVLYDLKVIDGELHKQWTGVDNQGILTNIRNLKKYIAAGKLRLWIRTPVIPGYTDREEIICEIAEFIRQQLSGCVERWELCAFNNSCVRKYEKLQLEWCMKREGILSQGKMNRLTELAKASRATEVICSGIMKEGKIL
ncbi:MAG: glycyl-radical enzyme activating protein [Lachnospiraceae bacterium]|nr:glycyl-radical enzyme activating protein [Lachnospiraceae bacterium]